MSMCVLGWSKEFKKYNIAVNSLWPKYSIATTAIKNILGSNYAIKRSLLPNIMSDAAYLILIKSSKQINGNFFIDKDILLQNGISNFDIYKVDPNIKDNELLPDFFLD